MRNRWLENAHVAMWLLKDMSWCHSWHWLGLLAVPPTLVMALRIAWDTRHDASECVHNVAVCLWICANITWMVGEFFFNDGTRGYASVFFMSGAGVLGAFYAWATYRWIRKEWKT